MRAHQVLLQLVLCQCCLGLLDQEQPLWIANDANIRVEQDSDDQPAGECAAASAVLRQSAPRSFQNVVAKEGRFPYVVSLVGTFSGLHQCGGVLVSSQFVLTAAQCVPDGIPDVEAHIGGFNLYDPGERKRIFRVYFPPEWTRNKLRGGDIALLKLESPSAISPLNLPGCSLQLNDNLVFSSLGWGRSSSGGAFATNLRLARPKFLNSDACKQRGTNWGQITPGMMCAGANSGGLCEGDEGSPTILQGIDVLDDILIGIASFRDGDCGDPKAPGVYTRVDYYRDWINRTIAG